MSGVLTRLIGIVGGSILAAAAGLYGIAAAAVAVSAMTNSVVAAGVGLAVLLALLFGVGAVAAKSGY